MNSLPMLSIIAQAVTNPTIPLQKCCWNPRTRQQKWLENVEEPPKSRKLTPQPLCSTERRMSWDCLTTIDPIHHLSYVQVFGKIFMENISTTGSGQNWLGIKPKAEPGGVRVRPDSAINLGKKNIFWTVVELDLKLLLNHAKSVTLTPPIVCSWPLDINAS